MVQTKINKINETNKRVQITVEFNFAKKNFNKPFKVNVLSKFFDEDFKLFLLDKPIDMGVFPGIFSPVSISKIYNFNDDWSLYHLENILTDQDSCYFESEKDALKVKNAVGDKIINYSAKTYIEPYLKYKTYEERYK